MDYSNISFSVKNRRKGMKKNVFDGIKILDHTSYLLGEYATQVFADFGAEVIKVENPRTGDYGRTLEPKINGVSYYNCALDRNKKSISLNLKSKKGKEVYLKLLKDADIVFENFRPGVMKRLGIDYEVEKSINPDIIHCAISAFGQDDPRSQLAYHDLNFQALCGYMYLNGPRHAPIHMCDMISAMVATQDMMAALMQRNMSGEGAFCDVKMFDCLVWWNAKIDEKWQFNGNRFEYSDLTFRFLGNWIWETKDGRHMVLCLNEHKFWNKWIDMTGFEEMRPYMMAREEERPEFFEKMKNFMLSKTLEEWKEWIGDNDVCATYVNNKTEAIDYILKQGDGLMEYCDFRLTGKTLQTRIPHEISSLTTIPLQKASAPPTLGENNVQIMERLGYSREDMEAMVAEGACGSIA